MTGIISLSGAVLQGVLNNKLRQRIQGPNAADVSIFIFELDA
jgi:hypothetical protein